MMSFDLIPTDRGDTFFKFDISYTFNLILENFYDAYTEEALLETNLFMVNFINIPIKRLSSRIVKNYLVGRQFQF
jgi:hypothetical protein